MRLAILQSNPVVGAVFENLRRLLAQAEDRLDAADLFVAPELALLGYPPRDVLSLSWILDEEAHALSEIAAWTARTGKAFLIGHTETRSGARGRPLFNAASLLAEGRVVGTIRKSRLPSYDIFDEDRHFEAWPATQSQPVFEWRGRSLGVFVCEDSWEAITAFGRRDIRLYTAVIESDPRFRADLIVNLSASPYSRRKRPTREALFCSLASRLKRPIVYANQAGGQDGVIYDGASFAVSPNGEIRAQGALFREDTVSVSLASLWAKAAGAEAGRGFNEWEELADAVVAGLRDFVVKSGNPKVLLGLSGGIDSALCAAIAARALGPDRVLGVSLPSSLTSSQSRSDAADLAARLGISYAEIPIAEAVSLHSRLAKVETGSVAHQNLQSRNRGLLLMALANREGRLLLATGNKSELAMGYTTLYGDMCGAVAPLGDLYKTEVYALAHVLNHRSRAAGGRDVIPLASILRPPTAELAPGQRDVDSLPPYEILDAALEGILENQGEPLVGAQRHWDKLLGPERSWRSLRRLVHRQEFKRHQAPPILRVHDRAFGAGWRFPVVKGLS